MNEVYRVAAALIWQDRNVLLPAYLLLAIPQFSSFISDFLPSSTTTFSIMLIERFFQLAFLFWLSQRWLNNLRPKKIKANASTFCTLLIYGFIFWFMIVIPAFIQLTDADEGSKLFFLFLLAPAVYLCVKYYFYFFPIMLGARHPSAIVSYSKDLAATDNALAFRVFIAPMAIMSLFTAIAMAPYPDGRVQLGYIIASACGAIFWFLCCYLSIAACLVTMGERDWHEAGLDPYRKARMSTLVFNSPGLLAAFLKPKNGLKILIISLLVWTANLIRLESMPPAALVEVTSIAVDKDELRLDLNVKDPVYHFQGFQPASFVIAGEKRSMVSEILLSAKISDKEDEFKFYLPPENDHYNLILKFKTNRSGKALTALEDLYLWYRHTKLLKLDMKSAKLSEEVAN